MPRHIAAIICFVLMIICGVLWRRGNERFETYFVPLVPHWSVRFHNSAGRQVVQLLPSS